MKTTKNQEIDSFLTSCSKEELGQILQKLLVLRGKSDESLEVPQNRCGNSPPEFFYDALLFEWKRKFGKSIPPYNTIYRHSGLPKNCVELDAFITRNLRPENTNDRRRAYRMMVRILIEAIEQWGIGLYLNTILGNVGKIPEIFESAFPGYLSNGMAGVVLKKKFGEKIDPSRQRVYIDRGNGSDKKWRDRGRSQ